MLRLLAGGVIVIPSLSHFSTLFNSSSKLYLVNLLNYFHIYLLKYFLVNSIFIFNISYFNSI